MQELGRLNMKIADTPVSTQLTVYLKDAIQQALNVTAGDVLEWHAENNTLYMKKRESEK